MKYEYEGSLFDEILVKSQTWNRKNEMTVLLNFEEKSIFVFEFDIR